MKIIDSDKEQFFWPLKMAVWSICSLGFLGVGMFFYPPIDTADYMMIGISILFGGIGIICVIYDGLIYPYYKNKIEPEKK